MELSIAAIESRPNNIVRSAKSMHSITEVHLRLLPVSRDGRFRSKVCTHLPNNAQNLRGHETQSLQQTWSHGPRAVSFASLSVAMVGWTHFATNVMFQTCIETTIPTYSDLARQNPMPGTSSRFVSFMHKSSLAQFISLQGRSYQSCSAMTTFQNETPLYAQAQPCARRQVA